MFNYDNVRLLRGREMSIFHLCPVLRLSCSKVLLYLVCFVGLGFYLVYLVLFFARFTFVRLIDSLLLALH